MSTKTCIERQEEATFETGVGIRGLDPTSPIDTQTWVNKTNQIMETNTSSINCALNKNINSILLPALNLDAVWGKAYKIINADSTFTFSNFADGVKAELTVINSDLYNSHTISFPSIKFTNTSSTNLILAPSETAIYTFTQTNSVIYCSVVKGVYPLNQTWGWGVNNSGQLGYNDTAYRSSPVAVVGNHSFVNVTCFDHSLGLKIDGSLWTWGNNSTASGALGDNTTNNRSSPVVVLGNHSFISIDSTLKGQNSYALKADGSCWAWGNNTPGAVGDNTTVSKSSPVQVIGAHSFIGIASSDQRGLGLKADGSLWGWGFGNALFYTSVGDNTLNPRSSPVLVVGGHSFISATSGYSHSLGLKVDGTVWGWGVQHNSLFTYTSGSLGDNTTFNRSSPVQAIGGHSFTSIAAGYNQSVGIKSDGSAWAWGYNYYGQLGHNDTNYRSSPVLVIGNHSFVSVSCFDHSLGLKIDGTVWAWGSGLNLGTNDTFNKSSPVQVIGNFSFTKIFGIGGQIINPNNF